MMNPDYNHLYLELGLQPDCGIDELRHAYRRHVSSLHPDRGERTKAAGARSLPLSDLNALYDEAIRFQVRYGRLPGASQPRMHSRGGTAAAASVSTDATPGGESGMPVASPGRRIWWALLLVAVIAGLMLGLPDAHSPATSTGHPVTEADMPREPARPLPTRLALGMDAATVLAIQGEPVRRSDSEWTYGPSWLRFEKGKLVDWYNSQLYPLRTDTPTPPPEPPEPVPVR